MNTVYALGHIELFTTNANLNSILTKAITPTAPLVDFRLSAVVHALTCHHGYMAAMTMVMTKKDSMDLHRKNRNVYCLEHGM